MTRITGTLREDLYKFLVIPGGIFVRRRNISDKISRENENTTWITDTLREDLYKFLVVPGGSFVRRRNISDKICK